MGQQFQLSGARQCFEMEENSDGCLSLMPKEPGIGCGESLKEGNQTPVFRVQKLEKFSKEETSSEGECREDKTTSSSGLTVLLMAPLLALASSQSNQSLPSFVKMKEIQPLHRLGQDMVNTPNYIIDTPALMTNEEDNFDSVCNNKVEEKPPSVYDQWQGNEVNSIQPINQETTMEHFFDLLENKDIQFFDEEDIQEDRDQRIDSVWNYKVVPRIDQLNLNIDSMENTEHLLLGHLSDLKESTDFMFSGDVDLNELWSSLSSDIPDNSVWNGKVVTSMDQQEDKPTSLYDLWQENEVKSYSHERIINKTEALSESLFQILLQGLLVLLASGTPTTPSSSGAYQNSSFLDASTLSGGACPETSAMESLQRFCILKGNQNFLTKNSIPTRSSMRNDSMRNEDPQFNQTQTTTPRRGDVKKILNEDNQKYEMETSYKVAFLL